MTQRMASGVPEVKVLLASFCWCCSAIAGCSASGSDDGSTTVGDPPASGAAGIPNVAGGSGGIDGETTICTGDDCLNGSGSGPTACGDGVLTSDEACDDGNPAPADGCSADCLAVDPGYSCSPPGAPCHVVALCGDGVTSLNEPCDDGGSVDGDGCSARCQLELGFACGGQPSSCSRVPCGDGTRQGAESCDDGNTLPLDGCTAACQAEPDCSEGACTSECGDGIVINEDCDDGNSVSGDGCSSSCTRELGFRCEQRSSCYLQTGGCVLRVPAVYRDFTTAHADFRCGGGTARPSVSPRLNSAGKPVLLSGNPGCIASEASFTEWYTDSASSQAFASSITLYDDGSGRFVNRYGSNGERWQNLTGAPLDGNPVFLPLDALPGAPAGSSLATIAPEYTGDGNWHAEADFVPGAGLHNFLFSTEIEYWFRFEVGFAAALEFLGDDDVWVFVNGVMALDLGGLHVPEQGTVTIDAASAATYDLAPGNVYSIKIFHAERNPTGSSFKLTLSGFQNTPTECLPICGDGIVSLGEECDDVVNDGGYGECEPTCKVGPRCGDRIVQEFEDCDDGNRIDGDGCGSACRQVVIR